MIKKSKAVSSSKVVRIDDFEGRLSTRPLYVYLPAGYDNDHDKAYPVLYMHDGQNLFERFEQDSYVGSWKADEIADRLIANGEMQACIIVGVSHGGDDRIQEYLPPYSQFPLRLDSIQGDRPIQGAANLTADYLIHDVAPYIQENYRVKTGRNNTATCGSSMGGLFSLYLAWEYADFAKNHAALSPSIWSTKNDQGGFKIVEKMRNTPSPPDIRLWIDSGTYALGKQGNDGHAETVLAARALLDHGFIDGYNLQHYLARGADHSEAAWSNRLDKIFKFLLLNKN